MKKIPLDKKLHFAAGVIIFLLSIIFFEKWIAMFIVLTIAILKEAVYDGLLKKGTPEIADVAWTMIGGFTVFMLFKAISLML